MGIRTRIWLIWKILAINSRYFFNHMTGKFMFEVIPETDSEDKPTGTYKVISERGVVILDGLSHKQAHTLRDNSEKEFKEVEKRVAKEAAREIESLREIYKNNGSQSSEPKDEELGENFFKPDQPKKKK